MGRVPFTFREDFMHYARFFIATTCLGTLCFAGTACTVESADGDDTSSSSSSGGGSSSSGGGSSSSSSGGGSSSSSSGGSSSSSSGSSSGQPDENPDPANFLPIPESEGSVRLKVEGDGWNDYDRSCEEIAEADSFHSVGTGDSYIQMTDACAALHGVNTVFKVYRAAGLAAGVYDITPDGDERSKVSLTAPDYPSEENDLTGRLWIRTAEVGANDTLLEASYYGSAQWDRSLDDDTQVDVVARVALKVRLRNTDVP